MSFNKTISIIVSFVIICVTTYSINAQNGQNILINGDFESNPPTNMGNNIGHSVVPWNLGSGQSSNVVRVDGPGGYDYGNAGPQSDASGVTNVPRHYLDITNGSNSFYQSFVPQCSGKVTVGGYFSTRANSRGTGRIEIRQGDGLNGRVIGQSVPVKLPGGTSQFDPWTLVSTQVNIQANQTYSFIVSMDNNMNFDEGFAEYDIDCGGSNTEVDLCCPPIYTEEWKDMLTIDGDFNNHYLTFNPTLEWRKKMQAYTNWRNAMDPCLTSYSFNITVRKPVAGTTDQFDLADNTRIAAIWIGFKVNGDNNIYIDSNNTQIENNGPFSFNTAIPSNRWHRIHAASWFNPSSCNGYDEGLCEPWKEGFKYNLQVVGNSSRRSGKLSGKLSNYIR